MFFWVAERVLVVPAGALLRDGRLSRAMPAPASAAIARTQASQHVHLVDFNEQLRQSITAQNLERRTSRAHPPRHRNPPSSESDEARVPAPISRRLFLACLRRLRASPDLGGPLRGAWPERPPARGPERAPPRRPLQQPGVRTELRVRPQLPKAVLRSEDAVLLRPRMPRLLPEPGVRARQVPQRLPGAVLRLARADAGDSPRRPRFRANVPGRVRGTRGAVRRVRGEAPATPAHRPKLSPPRA